jgi:hypothetical protein
LGCEKAQSKSAFCGRYVTVCVLPKLKFVGNRILTIDSEQVGAVGGNNEQAK